MIVTFGKKQGAVSSDSDEEEKQNGTDENRKARIGVLRRRDHRCGGDSVEKKGLTTSSDDRKDVLGGSVDLDDVKSRRDLLGDCGGASKKRNTCDRELTGRRLVEHSRCYSDMCLPAPWGARAVLSEHRHNEARLVYGRKKKSRGGGSNPVELVARAKRTKVKREMKPSSVSAPKYTLAKSPTFPSVAALKSDDTPIGSASAYQTGSDGSLDEVHEFMLDVKNGEIERVDLYTTMSTSETCSLEFTRKRKRPGRYISPSTLTGLLQRPLGLRNYILIDCRYPYEYEGGRILGAVSWWLPSILLRELFVKRVYKRSILVFYCEFSSYRAPKLAQLMRNYDVRVSGWRSATYRETYILENGYSCYQKKKSSREYLVGSDEGLYVPMNDREHVESEAMCKRTLESEMSFFKQNMSSVRGLADLEKLLKKHEKRKEKRSSASMFL